MILKFLPEAEADFSNTALWYEAKQEGLGARFRDEIARVLHRISEDPFFWRERRNGYRRVNCPVFPYFIAYVIRNKKVIIVAIVHGHREPEFWKGRLN